MTPVYTPPRGSDAPPSEGALMQKLHLLWNGRRLIWRVLWISALGSAVVAMLIHPRYSSTARVVPSDSNSGSMMGALMARAGGAAGATLGGTDAASLLGLKTPGAFYIEILQSRTVEDAVINKFDLRARYRDKYYKDARKKLEKMSSFVEEKKSGVITLQVSDYDPAIAQQMLQTYIDEMTRLASQLDTSAAHRERVFLEERLKTAKQELDESELQLADFSSRHSMATDVQQQGRSMMDAAARLEGEMIASESDLKSQQQIYSDDSVQVRTLRARIGELRSQLNKMVGHYTPAGGQEQQGAGPDSPPPIRSLPALGYQYSDLYRRAKVQETVYEVLTQQYEVAKVQEAKEVPTVRVLDPPDKPEKKDFPIRSEIVILSMIFAFVLACLYVVERDSVSHWSTEDPRRKLAEEIRRDIQAHWQKLRDRNSSGTV